MNYSISLILDLKNNSNHMSIENLIYDSGNNCNTTSIYNDYELEGINNYIKKNNKIIILEFDNKIFLCNFIKFIKHIKEITIEYIYESNIMLYATKKYLNSINNRLHNKQDLIKKITENKLKDEFREIYNSL